VKLLENVRVFVVDDDVAAREVLEIVLGREGAVVATAGSGDEALRRVDEVSPDVMLVDLSMPVMNGFTLIEQLRLRPVAAGDAIPIAALTGYISSVDRDRADRAGCQAYLVKPVEPAELLETVRSLAATRAAIPAPHASSPE
jgi:CheY-like chemotaxis protein